MFEKEVCLVRNPKALRTKPWVARVDLEREDIEFLKPVEYKSTYTRIYEFDNGEFYIVCSDESSHKNKHVEYTLYMGANNELVKIASVTFTRFPAFHAIDEEAKSILKKAYNSANNNKTVTALVETAKWYAAKFNINGKSIEDQIRLELAMMCKKYRVTIDKIIKVAKSF
ncbi:hypothetical protein DRO54_06225 [Candidatus Bathyarchaeota archaeon]|nr:MAG: hypothetical protein DRO54_06225 [Candidatus Bathyarchaeota archaeon]